MALIAAVRSFGTWAPLVFILADGVIATVALMLVFARTARQALWRVTELDLRTIICL